MEVWTLINQKNNKIVKFNVMNTPDDEFDIKYYLLEVDGYPLWFVETYDEVKIIFESKYIHPSQSINYNKPNIDNINMSDYKIIKFYQKFD